MMRIAPSYKSGFYSPQRGGIPAHPELWKGCVGAWSPGLGPTGSTLFDQSVYRGHGTLTSMDPATDWNVSSGVPSLIFDGTDDRIVVPYNARYLAQNLGTISGWIYPTEFTSLFNNADICGMDLTSGTRGWVLSCQFPTTSGDTTANLQNIVWGTGGGSIRVRTSTQVVPINAWTHVATTYDGSGTYAGMAIFMNGVKQTTSDFSSGTFTAHTTPSNPLLIAGRQNISDAQLLFIGSIAETMLHARIMPQNEIRTLAQRPGIAYETRRRRVYSGAAATGNRRRRLLIGS